MAEHAHTHGQLIFNKRSLQLNGEMIMFSANGAGTTEKPYATVKIINLYATLIASLVARLVKNLPAMRETWVRSLGWEEPLEKRKATHSSILAWKIPGTVQSLGSQRVRHD